MKVDIKLKDKTLKKGGETTGIVFNFQQFSIQDGPGLRTTMFVKGCPLRCPWCSNPESIYPSYQIKVVQEKCRGCGECLKVCKTGALSHDENHQIVFDYSKCNQCLDCVDACHHKAITGVGIRVTVKEAVGELMKDKPFYDNTGGGVTISGGEPLLQHEFVADVFKELKKKGVHTALDTTGYAPWNIVEKVTKDVDLVLYDIKHLDSKRHQEILGVKNEVILENLNKLAGKLDIWLRVPLVPGFNDDLAMADKIVELGRKVQAKKVYFLPLHRWGEHKYCSLGYDGSAYAKIKDFTDEELEKWRDHFKSFSDYVIFGKA
jgi:pyruvate formate lyase activating enzyme